jgi:GNAT superfamily N-acetyltransferase
VKTTVRVSTPLVRSARLAQVQGMFDVPPTPSSDLSWDVDLPVEQKPWNVGLVVGPSGCGKSTVARNLWPEEFNRTYQWPADRSLLDAFPPALGIKDIVQVLSSVGFSSPPAWARPFHVLSNGEQFRVTMARALAEAETRGPDSLTVVDEFTSVVDRTVAQVGSCALAKTVRRRNQRFIAVTCHNDVEEWLQPDWVYEPALQRFTWRSVQRRPDIELEVNRVHHSAWKLFHPHHYLTADINKAAFCFVAFWKGQPVAFDAWLPFFGKLKTAQQARRGHRTVCLPDFQGVGIGAALFAHLASMWAGLGYRAFSATAHPAEIAARRRNPSWHMTRAPSFTAKDTGKMAGTRMSATRASQRLTASFEWCGPKMTAPQATLQLNTWASIS